MTEPILDRTGLSRSGNEFFCTLADPAPNNDSKGPALL